ncbi:MAG: transposase [Nitrososphaeria archaeon]
MNIMLCFTAASFIISSINWVIKWDLSRPILNGKGTEAGRPNVDVVVMAKMLVLQTWYSLSDEQLEKLDLKVEEGESKDVAFMKVEEKEVKASKDNARLQDSTMLEADPGSQTVGDTIKMKEIKAKGDKDAKGTSISISYEEMKKSKERGNEAKT